MEKYCLRLVANPLLVAQAWMLTKKENVRGTNRYVIYKDERMTSKEAWRLINEVKKKMPISFQNTQSIYWSMTEEDLTECLTNIKDEAHEVTT